VGNVLPVLKEKDDKQEQIPTARRSVNSNCVCLLWELYFFLWKNCCLLKRITV